MKKVQKTAQDKKSVILQHNLAEYLQTRNNTVFNKMFKGGNSNFSSTNRTNFSDPGKKMFRVWSNCGNYIYHIGIIDYLQPWNLAKRGETFLKTRVKGVPSIDVSSIEPVTYGKRFLTYMENKVFLDDKDI